ncbi:ATP-binding protein [Candidatus Bathyarchaeota archaeon]|nr:ATP-binding protein [Candidatus Bathyarchaeota archaeon]
MFKLITPRLIKQLFAMARESKPAVIFIDEIDALCSARGEGGESEASRRIKTEFLVQMDGVDNNNEGILVLGATNLPWGLDTAMLRRFQRVVHIGLPNPAGRAKLFQMAVGETPSTLSMHDFSELARMSEGFSGSDITNVVRQSLMYPVRKITRATHFKIVSLSSPSWPLPYPLSLLPFHSSLLFAGAVEEREC